MLDTHSDHAGNRQVELIGAGLTAYMRPAVDAVIERLRQAKEILPSTELTLTGEHAWFSFVSSQCPSSNDFGCWVSDALSPRFHLPVGRWFSFPAGLICRIQLDLQELGYAVNTHFSTCTLPGQSWAVDDQVRESSSDSERSLLDCVHLLPRGTIVVSHKLQIAENAAAIARLFRQARILIPVATNAEVDRLAGQVSELIGETVGASLNTYGLGDHRCTILNWQAFQHVDGKCFEIAIVPEADAILAESRQKALLRLPWLRTYSFLSSGLNLTDTDRLVINAFLGPEIFREPEWPRRAQVRVVLCEAPRSQAEEFENPVDRKRSMLWLNESRNRFIAQLAEDCAKYDWPAVSKLGVVFDEGTIAQLASTTKPRIVILVESAEHAEALSGVMPSAERIVMSPDYGVCRSPGAAQAGSAGLITILTTRAAKDADWTADVVIRASGEASTIEFPGWPRILNDGDPEEIQVLIDICDDCDSQERRFLDYRKSQYSRRGW